MQEHASAVYAVATANDVRALPPELLSRFDDIFFVDTPTRRGRAEIFAIHLRKRSLAPDAFDVPALVEATEGYTGREIEKIVRQAMRRAFYAGARPVATEDLLDAARMIVPATRTNAEQVRALREWAASRALPASSPDPSEKGRRSGLEL